MRVAFFAHLSEVSGAGIALLDTAVAFQKAGHDVTFILPGPGDLYGRAEKRELHIQVISNEERSIEEATAIGKIGLMAGRVGYIRRVRDYLKHNQTQIAYVNSSASLFAGIGARLAGIPIVWHVHETLDAKGRLIAVKKRVIQRLADGMVYASQSALEAFPPGQLPSMIARNAIDMAGFLNVRSKRSGLHPGKHLILLNGTIRRKGADILLRALDQLNRSARPLKFTAVITGADTTDPVFYREITQLAATLDLTEQVEFAGLQDNLASMLEKANVFVSASRNEAMPIAIVEAMAAHVPVVSTSVGDCAELLENGRCGWVVAPEDPAALASAISEALENPAEAALRAESAAEKVDRLYGAEDFWKPLLDFVEQVSAQR